MQRLSGTATDLGGGDATFLSTSHLGTPNAFSTAIKPQPMSTITSSPSWMVSMSLTEDPLGFINGTRNSLSEGVVGPQLLENEDRTTNKGSDHVFQTQEDTTLGILDLDNLPDLSSSKFLTSPYKPISSGDHTSSSFSQTPAKYSAMSGFALQYSTSQSTGDFDKITAGVTDEQYILSQEGIPIQFLQRTSSVSSNDFMSSKETSQEEDNEEEEEDQSFHKTSVENSIISAHDSQMTSVIEYSSTLTPTDRLVTSNMIPVHFSKDDNSVYSSPSLSSHLSTHSNIPLGLPSQKSPVRDSSGVENTTMEGMGLSAYLIPSSPIDPSLTMDDSHTNTTVWEENGNSQIHNPFDSDDNYDQNFEEMKFDRQNKDSFLSELKKDEEVAAAFPQDTPSSLQTTFTIPSANVSELVVPGDEEISITTYFKGRSYPLGSKLSPNNIEERPQFAPERVIVSPPGLIPNSSTSSPISPSKATPIPVHIHQQLMKPVVSSDLTPLVTSLSPESASIPIPKLDLVQLLTNLSSSTTYTEPSFINTQSSFGKEHTNPIIQNQNVSSTRLGRLGESDVPSCNRTSYGTTNDSTLLLPDVSTLTITPFPTRLREQLNITGLTCIPTPSIAHVTHMFNMTEVDDTFYDVSSMMNENEEDSKMKEKLTEEDWSKDKLVTEDQKIEKEDWSKEELVKENQKKERLTEEDQKKEKLTEEDWSKEELVKEDQKKEKLTEEDHKKETLSETHFLTHKSAIYQSHEDIASKQIPSTKSFHVAGIHVVPSCTLKKSPKEDFDSDITSHTSTFSPHKLASFSVLDNPSQHSSLISHSSLSESCRSSSTPSPPLSPRSQSIPNSSPSTLSPSTPPPSPPSLIPSPLAQSAAKAARIKATLDATRFDAQMFLASLKNQSPVPIPPSSSLHQPKSLLPKTITPFSSPLYSISDTVQLSSKLFGDRSYSISHNASVSPSQSKEMPDYGSNLSQHISTLKPISSDGPPMLPLVKSIEKSNVTKQETSLPLPQYSLDNTMTSRDDLTHTSDSPKVTTQVAQLKSQLSEISRVTSQFSEVPDFTIQVPNVTSQPSVVSKFTTQPSVVSEAPKVITQSSVIPKVTTPSSVVPKFTTQSSVVSEAPKVTTQSSVIPKVTTPSSVVPKFTTQFSEAPKVTTQSSVIPKVTTQSSVIPKVTTTQSSDLPKFTTQFTEALKVTTQSSEVPKVPSQPSVIPKVTSQQFVIPKVTTQFSEALEVTQSSEVLQVTNHSSVIPKVTSQISTQLYEKSKVTFQLSESPNSSDSSHEFESDMITQLRDENTHQIEETSAENLENSFTSKLEHLNPKHDHDEILTPLDTSYSFTSSTNQIKQPISHDHPSVDPQLHESVSNYNPVHSRTCTSVNELQYNASLIYTTPMHSTKTQTSFHTLPLTDSPFPQSLTSSLPPIQSLFTPSHSTITNMLPEVEVPSSVIFDKVACIYTVQHNQVILTNKTRKWIQCKLITTQILLDDNEQLLDSDHKVFNFPAKCFIGPNKQEIVKLSFSPRHSGKYQAILNVIHNTGSINHHVSQSPLASIKIEASAEKPRLQILTGNEDTMSLDYGVVLAGKNTSLPFYIVNHGHADVPLRLSFSTTTLFWFCFAFEYVPDSLLIPSETTSQVDKQVSNTRSVRVVLPAKPDNEVESVVHSLMIQFRAPVKSTDDTLGIGRVEECSSKLDIFIDGSSDAAVSSIPLKAIVGVARLHAPRSIQHMSFSCDVGGSISRSVPLKNAGNVPIVVKMECDQCVFTLHPDVLELKQNEESYVQIRFSPSLSAKVTEGILLMHVEPQGPSYQIKLRGVARDMLPELSDGMLECSQQSLFWAGGEIGQGSLQDLIIRSTHSKPVTLEVSVRDPEIFQLQISGSPVSSGLHTSIGPHSQDTVHVLYIPSSTNVQLSALDILDTVHNKRYKIPLFGYGGNSEIIALNCLPTQDGLQAGLGEVGVGRKNVFKLKLANTGQKAAFVKPVAYQGNVDAVLSCDKLNISPSDVIIHPHQTKELLLTYHGQKEDLDLQIQGMLARLVLYTGDEVLRRLASSLLKETSGLSPLVDMLIKNFPEQDSVPFDFEHVLVNGIKPVRLLEGNTKSIHITLTGRLVVTPSSLPPQHQSPPNPNEFISKYPHSNTGSSTVSQSPPIRGNKILPVHTVSFRDTLVKYFGESFLEIHNPYPVVINWRLSSAGPSFVKEVERSGSVYKAKYTAFWVHQCVGQIQSQNKTSVLVTFQPHDVGLYSQIWDLEVSGEGLGVMKFRVSFGGKAISNIKSKSEIPHVITSHTNDFSSNKRIANTDPRQYTVSPLPWEPSSKTFIYMNTDNVNFPETKVGEETMIKIRVINKDTCTHQFQVIQPQSPFFVVHHEFELTPRHSARLPIYFKPTKESQSFEGILAVRTTTGHQMFAILRGNSL